MTTMLEEIKQRDASFVGEHLPEALDASHLSDKDGNDAVKDRRWLLARVEYLATAVELAIAVLERNGHYQYDVEQLQKALASLTAPVSSHSEEQS